MPARLPIPPLALIINCELAKLCLPIPPLALIINCELAKLCLPIPPLALTTLLNIAIIPKKPLLDKSYLKTVGNLSGQGSLLAWKSSLRAPNFSQILSFGKLGSNFFSDF